jgi:hypothetical protein
MEKNMKIVSRLFLLLILFTFYGCGFFDQALFFRDSGITVTSCPSNVELIVEDVTCITPCKVFLYDDTPAVNVSYRGKSSLIPLNLNGLRSYNLTGTLVIMNPDKLGQRTDRADTVFYMQDYSLAGSMCGIEPPRTDIVEGDVAESSVVLMEDSIDDWEAGEGGDDFSDFQKEFEEAE